MPSINLYETRIMLQAIEMMDSTNTFLRDTFFPTTNTFLSENVDIDYYKGRRKMAPFVSPRSTGKVMDRQGFVTKSFKPAMIKPMRIITGDDITRRSMGENIYSAKSPDERAAQILAQDLTDLDNAITRREEWMAAQILFTGKVDIKGDDVDATIDFDFDNKETLSGIHLWNKPESNPIADLKKWRLQVIKKSGVNPDRVIMASDVVDAFISNQNVKDSLDNRRVILGQINPSVLPGGVTYIGSISILGLDIYSYDEWYFDEETQTEKSMVPEGTIMLGSSSARSSMLYGAVTLTDQNTNQFITYEGSRIPDSWIKKDPAARILQLYSRPLPVPHEVDSWFIGKVL